MLHTTLSRAAITVLLTASALTSVTAMAKDGRDFAGNYSLTNVTEKGEQVEVTLGLLLFNYTGADLRGAAVTVRPFRPEPSGPRVEGSFAPIQLWRSGRDVVLHQQLTVSKDEFQGWSRSTPPIILITYNDGAGRHQRPVQLSRRPVLPASPALAQP
jgi:hypothetical protein